MWNVSWVFEFEVSLDFPFYDELARRKHRGAKWWRLGDSLYYLGILTALAGLGAGLAWAVMFVFGEPALSAWWVVLFPSGLLVFVMGASLKSHSYELARRDGIPTEY